eukprot:9046571-Pyramimonas_sp.AAC.1
MFSPFDQARARLFRGRQVYTGGTASPVYRVCTTRLATGRADIPNRFAWAAIFSEPTRQSPTPYGREQHTALRSSCERNDQPVVLRETNLERRSNMLRQKTSGRDLRISGAAAGHMMRRFPPDHATL